MFVCRALWWQRQNLRHLLTGRLLSRNWEERASIQEYRSSYTLVNAKVAPICAGAMRTMIATRLYATHGSSNGF